MSNVKWTDEQLAAIDAGGRSLLLSAAAGSGKTAVLVEKLTRLLEDPDREVSADSIIVVTFTNDAAASMKNKLCQSLNNRLADLYREKAAAASQQEKDALDIRADYIALQLSLIPSANISTISSFCFNLIREHAGQAGVDASFEVRDENEEKIILERVCSDTLDRWFRERGDDIKTLTDFFCRGKQNADELAEIVLELRKKYMSLPFPLRRMKELTDYYQHNAESPDFSKGLLKEYVSIAEKDLHRAREMAQICINCLKHYANGNEDKEPFLSNIRPFMSDLNVLDDLVSRFDRERRQLDTCPDGSGFFLFSDNSCRPEIDFTLVDSSGKKLPNRKKMEITDNEGNVIDLKSVLDKIREKYIRIVSDYFRCTGCPKSCIAHNGTMPCAFTVEQIKDDLAVHARICGLLFELTRDVIKGEKDEKNNANILCFSDAEQIACSLLCNEATLEKTDLARDISSRTGIIMIDEFQDSSSIQELIFRMLSMGGTADTPGTNMFAVGDIKQSIYRFRSAEPELFKANLANSSLYSENDSDHSPAHILLTRNFRSSPAVISAVNGFFRTVMSEETGGVDYGAGDSLTLGRTDCKSCCPVTEIIDLPDKKDDNDSEHISDAEDTEAEIVAARIDALIKSGAAPQDICILCRSSGKFGSLRDALLKRNIPAVRSADDNLLDAGEVKAVINLLRVIDNPYRDVALAAALMSPLFMFTAEDLSEIKLYSIISCGDLQQDIPLFIHIKRAAECREIPAGLKVRCQGFIRDLESFSDYALSHTAAEVIGYIYEKTGFTDVIAGKDAGQGLKNLHMLMSAAESAGKNNGGALSSFIRKINRMYENGGKIAAADSIADKAVTIETIHKSKGLEYPYVFLCDTGRRKRKDNAVLYFNSTFGAGFEIVRPVSDKNSHESLRYPSLPSVTIGSMMKSSELDEDLMLLYVAMTRAREQIIITEKGSTSALTAPVILARFSDSVKKDTAVRAYTNLGDIIDVGLTAFGRSESGIYDPENPYLYSEINGAALLSKSIEEYIAPEAEIYSDDSLTEKLIGNMRCDYDLTLSNTPSKLSVSAVAEGKTEFILPTFKTAPTDCGDDADKALLDAENAEKSGLIPDEEPDEYEDDSLNITRSAGAVRGTAVHGFMEHADFDKLGKCQGSMENAVKEEIARMIHQGLLEENQAEYIDPAMIAGFVSSENFRKMLEGGEIMRERKFLAKISDLALDDEALKVYNNTEGILQGVADLIYKDSDGYVLCDYKTDRHVTDEMLLARYGNQLRIYAKAFSLILDSPVRRAYIYSFWSGRWIRTAV